MKRPPRRVREQAAAIARRLFGESPRALRPRGGGLTNAVFQAELRQRSVIIRINEDPARHAAFAREAAAIRLAASHGIPTPKVLHVGADPVPHMVLARAPGEVATRYTADVELIRAMGELTARIHRIPVRGFGPGALPVRGRQLRGWPEHLRVDLKALERLDALERLGVLTPAALEQMRRTLHHMATWRRSAVLHHGDMRLKNLMVGRDRRIVCVLDWENALGSVPAIWDLSIALHDLNIDGKEAFLQGYGLRPQHLARMAPFLRLINALNYAPVVSQMAERGQGRRLGWQRARLAGHLDLY